MAYDVHFIAQLYHLFADVVRKYVSQEQFGY